MAGQQPGFTEAEVKLLRLAKMLTDLRPFWPRVVPIYVSWMRRQFETEGAYGGMPWEPLSDAYYWWKQEHFPGKGILQATGDLRRAVTMPKRVARPLLLELIPDESKNTHHGPVLAYHQEGTSKMPARPLLFGGPFMPQEPRLELDVAAQAYAREMVARLGIGPGTISAL